MSENDDNISSLPPSPRFIRVAKKFVAQGQLLLELSNACSKHFI